MWLLLSSGRFWGVLVLLAGIGYSHYWAFKTGEEHTQSKWDKEKAELIAQHEAAEQAARAREQSMQRKINDVATKAQKRQDELAAQVVAANRAVGSLRDEINALNARGLPSDSTAAAYAIEARTARQLLEECADQYTTVATEADRLSGQVSGLQDYAASLK